MAVCSHCSSELPMEARFCQSCGRPAGQHVSVEPQFHAWQIRRAKRAAMFCAIAIAVGLLFIQKSPFTFLWVSGLGELGLILSLIRLSRLKRAA